MWVSTGVFWGSAALLWVSAALLWVSARIKCLLYPISCGIPHAIFCLGQNKRNCSPIPTLQVNSWVFFFLFRSADQRRFKTIKSISCLGIFTNICICRPKTGQRYHNAYSTSAKCGLSLLNTTVPKANSRMVTPQKYRVSCQSWKNQVCPKRDWR